MRALKTLLIIILLMGGANGYAMYSDSEAVVNFLETELQDLDDFYGVKISREAEKNASDLNILAEVERLQDILNGDESYSLSENLGKDGFEYLMHCPQCRAECGGCHRPANAWEDGSVALETSDRLR